MFGVLAATAGVSSNIQKMARLFPDVFIARSTQNREAFCLDNRSTRGAFARPLHASRRANITYVERQIAYTATDVSSAGVA